MASGDLGVFEFTPEGDIPAFSQRLGLSAAGFYIFQQLLGKQFDEIAFGGALIVLLAVKQPNTVAIIGSLQLRPKHRQYRAFARTKLSVQADHLRGIRRHDVAVHRCRHLVVAAAGE
ncbi:hypothetical protein D3C78_1315430 [compost metagenome]